MDVLLLYLEHKGYTQLYFKVDQYGWPWIFISLAVVLFVDDAFFYWTHRAMHHPRLYKFFHKVHHESTDPSPLTAFAFHPSEAIIENAMNVVLPFIFPLHFGVVIVWQVFSMLNNVMGHLGYELYPAGWTKTPFLRYKTASVHHNMHHQVSNHNYGLYFNIWDRLMGTNHPDYDRYFEQVKARSQASKATTKVASIGNAGLKAGATVALLLTSLYCFGQLNMKDIKSGHYGTPEQRCAQADSMMQRGLGLRPDQVKKVHDINLHHAYRTEQEVVKQNLSDWAKYRKLNALQKDRDKDLKGVLDKGQFEKYEKKRDEMFWLAMKDYFF